TLLAASNVFACLRTDRLGTFLTRLVTGTPALAFRTSQTTICSGCWRERRLHRAAVAAMNARQLEEFSASPWRRGVHQFDTIPNRREKTHGPVSRLAEQTRP